VAADYLEALMSIVDHCRSADVIGFVPSDFKNAGLNQDQLDELMEKIGRPRSEQ